MVIFNPPHPGETLLEDVLPELARHLGFTHKSLSLVLHGQGPISPDLGVRLERAGVGRARTWLDVQTDYDLRQTRHREQPHIERF